MIINRLLEIGSGVARFLVPRSTKPHPSAPTKNTKFKNPNIIYQLSFRIFSSAIYNFLNSINQRPHLIYLFGYKSFHIKEDTEAIINKAAEYVQWHIPIQRVIPVNSLITYAVLLWKWQRRANKNCYILVYDATIKM